MPKKERRRKWLRVLGKVRTHWQERGGRGLSN
jgi:hypothetical protein